MNRRLKIGSVTLLVVLFLVEFMYAGVFTAVQEPMGANQGVCVSSIAFGDIDNDGDLDLAVTGAESGSSQRFIIYRNDGGIFTAVQEPMGANQGVQASSIAFGDIDNDGDLDLAVTGQDSSLNNRFIIYRNDGGIFTAVQEPMGANQGVYYSSIALGDIDNDGDLDLAVTGAESGSSQRFIIYRNDGGIFTAVQEPMGANQGVYYSSIALGDIDNDGDLDLAVTGAIPDEVTMYRFIIYRNDGGVFTAVQEPMGANQGIASSIAYGDIDNDGDLDLAVTGVDSNGSERFIIYRNDGGVFTAVQEPMGANQGVYDSSIAYGDYDNDGDLDLVVTGWDNSEIRHFKIFRNDNSTFTLGQEPMGANLGVRQSSIAFGDYDNDGDLDLAVTGRDSGGNYRFIIFRNDEATANTPPSVPIGMLPDGTTGYWRLSWNQSTDDHTPSNILRYQIAIGTNPGVYDYASTNIDYPRGQANIGKVTVVTGTPYYQTKITNTKTIYWKVCAIDSAFKYSGYCEEQTTVERAANFELMATKLKIKPDGIEWTEIKNNDTIKNEWEVTISDGNIFYIEVIEGEGVIIEAEMTNGKYYVKSTNGNIRFRVRGSIINKARIRVSWAGDSSIGDSIDILISPDMDIMEQNDAIAYNTIVNPDKGDILELYINSREGEEIEILIYDIEDMRLVKRARITGGALKYWEWDLRQSNGMEIPDGRFGVVIKGEGWRKEIKFIVARWYRK